MFRKNLGIHHHQHVIVHYITQFCTVGTIYYAVLLMMNYYVLSKHVEQTKNCGIKIDYKNLCISLVINTLQYDARYTQRQISSNQYLEHYILFC